MRWRLQGNTITPESFAIAGGRVTFDGSDWEAQYYITDHLGSTRAVTDTLGNVLATFDYTPYGELLAATDNTTAGTDYLFTGKENQAKQGAGELYDSQARFMDTEGRFLSIDPLAEKYYHLSPYAYCAGDPVNLVDPDGEDWYSIKKKNESGNYITSYEYTDYKSQEELDKNNIEGRYLGNALVIVIGTYDEKIGKNKTMLDDDAVAATFTIYGVNGKDDIKSYCGLTVSSDPTKFPMLLEGEYMATHQQMATSPYGKGSLTYIIKTMDGSTMLPPVGGYNIATKKNYMDEIFLHRTNWDGKATNASVGCLVIDGRSWKDVEKQLRKSKKIFISLTRNKEQP